MTLIWTRIALLALLACLLASEYAYVVTRDTTEIKTSLIVLLEWRLADDFVPVNRL